MRAQSTMNYTRHGTYSTSSIGIVTRDKDEDSVGMQKSRDSNQHNSYLERGMLDLTDESSRDTVGNAIKDSTHHYIKGCVHFVQRGRLGKTPSYVNEMTCGLAVSSHDEKLCNQAEYRCRAYNGLRRRCGADFGGSRSWGWRGSIMKESNMMD